MDVSNSLGCHTKCLPMQMQAAHIHLHVNMVCPHCRRQDHMKTITVTK